jgi:hypothetical protein
MEWWIKIHRKLDEWEWRDKPWTFSLYIHCLMLANREDKKRRGIEIKRGSFVTTLRNLAKITGLTVRSIRTALEHLKSTHNLTSTPTNKYTLITVVWYDKYQSTEDKATQWATQWAATNRHSTDTQPTHTKNIRKKEEEENIVVPLEPGGLEWFTSVANQMKVELLEIWPSCTESQFAKTVAKCYEWATRGGKELNRPEQLLRSWFSKQLDFMSGYEAGLTWPGNPEQWVKEYNEIKGIKFEEKYGAEKAREVREWRFNKDMYGIYIVTENKDGR